jgi:hypothetical protein
MWMKLCLSHLIIVLIIVASIIWANQTCMFILRLKTAAESTFKAKKKGFSFGTAVERWAVVGQKKEPEVESEQGIELEEQSWGQGKEVVDRSVVTQSQQILFLVVFYFLCLAFLPLWNLKNCFNMYVSGI